MFVEFKWKQNIESVIPLHENKILHLSKIVYEDNSPRIKLSNT